mmetsp:Transcript_6637/g.17281  ORF Transcript_6637/g.17281 Transcript_6637/m.17281 type:complete len:449 (-) Transcript_6637:630-1976(-)
MALVIQSREADVPPPCVEQASVASQHLRDHRVESLHVCHHLHKPLAKFRLGHVMQLRQVRRPENLAVAIPHLRRHTPRQLQAHRVEGIAHALLFIHVALQRDAQWRHLLERLHLALELAHNQARAPLKVHLRHAHVRVDVIADVQNLVARNAERLLDHPRGASGEHAALLVSHRRSEKAILGCHLVDEIAAVGEEVWLRAADDGDVEEVAPCHVVGKVGVVRVLHDALRVHVVAVRDQQKLLARALLVKQRESILRVHLHKLRRVADDLSLQLALDVRVEQRLADSAPEAFVALDVVSPPSAGPVLLAVEAVDHLRVQRRFADAEERVEEHPPVVAEVHALSSVRLAALRRGHHARSVRRALHHTESIRLHEVSELLVDDESSDDHLAVEAESLDGTPGFAQLLLGVVVRASFPLVYVVVHERVVHVISKHLDASQVERSTAEDASSG